MDDVHFDALTRALSVLADRRVAARTLTSGAFGLLAMLASQDADARKKKKKKGKKKKKKNKGKPPETCQPDEAPCGDACCPAEQTCIAGACLGACQFTNTENPSTMTLQANCATTGTIAIPDNFTLEGNGKTIHMAGLASGYQTVTAGVTQVRAGLLITGGRTSVKNLTIDQDAFECEAGPRHAAIVMVDALGDIESVAIATAQDNRPCFRGIDVAVAAGGNSNVNIRDVTITGGRFSGIAVSGPVFGEIRDSSVSGVSFGMVVNTGVRLTIKENTVDANVGITVGSFPSDVFVDDNTVTGLVGATNLFGVNFEAGAVGTVTNNAISGFTCGVAIQSTAGEVDVTPTNTFPNPPGNGTNVCDPPA